MGEEEAETPEKEEEVKADTETIETPENEKVETETITWLVSPNLSNDRLTEVTEIIENLNTDKDKDVEIKISEIEDREAETKMSETPDILDNIEESPKTEEIEKTTWHVSPKLSDEKFTEVTEIIKKIAFR